MVHTILTSAKSRCGLNTTDAFFLKTTGAQYASSIRTAWTPISPISSSGNYASGAQASATNGVRFYQHSTGNNSEIVLSDDPAGVQTPVWQNITDGANTHPGMFTELTNNWTYDATHEQMMTVYVRRTSDVTPSGSFYFGTTQYGDEYHVYDGNVVNAHHNNRYFISGQYISILPYNVWCVAVGFMRKNTFPNSLYDSSTKITIPKSVFATDRADFHKKTGMGIWQSNTRGGDLDYTASGLKCTGYTYIGIETGIRINDENQSFSVTATLHHDSITETNSTYRRIYIAAHGSSDFVVSSTQGWQRRKPCIQTHTIVSITTWHRHLRVIQSLARRSRTGQVEMEEPTLYRDSTTRVVMMRTSLTQVQLT